MSSEPRISGFAVVGEVQLLVPGNELPLLTLLALNNPAKFTLPLVIAVGSTLLVALMSVNVTAKLNGTLEKLSGEVSVAELVVVRV